MKQRNLSWPLACVLLGCTWTRFDDVTENPPVERFDVPSGVTGAGRALSTTLGSSAGAYLAATSTESLLVYALGSGVSPSRTAIANQPCPRNASCLLGKQLAGLEPSALFGNQACIAYGVGLLDEGTTPVPGKIRLWCENGTQQALAVPESVTSWLSGQWVNSDSVFNLATTRRGNWQPLAASIPDARVTWFYDGVDPSPIELPALPDNATAGRSLAVIGDSGGYVIATGSVNTDDTIWLYRVNADRTAAVAGCITGSSQFGRLLATGNFDNDGVDDIAVADAQGVAILNGSSVAAVAQNTDGNCATLDAIPLIGSAVCSQVPDLDGCAGAPYAGALATGNLDGAGPDELVVGAPFTSVRGEGAAGAAFVYTLGNGTLQLAQGLYMSTAASGNLLGSSLAIAHVSDIDTVMAGAPGDNAVVAFYCNSLMPAPTKSARCH